MWTEWWRHTLPGNPGTQSFLSKTKNLETHIFKFLGKTDPFDEILLQFSFFKFAEGEENKEESKEDDLIKKEKEKEKEKEREKEAEEKVSDEDKLGVEFIRKVEAFYCEVCRIYLPRLMNKEKALRIHCRSKNHLKCYLRYGTEELLDQIQDKGDKKKSKTSGEKSVSTLLENTENFWGLAGNHTGKPGQKKND